MICWPILYFIAWKCTTDTNYLSEDGAIAPVHVRKELGIEGAEVGDGEAENEAGTVDDGKVEKRRCSDHHQEREGGVR
jgi:hypothetical protein